MSRPCWMAATAADTDDCPTGSLLARKLRMGVQARAVQSSALWLAGALARGTAPRRGHRRAAVVGDDQAAAGAGGQSGSGNDKQGREGARREAEVRPRGTAGRARTVRPPGHAGW